MKKAFLFLASAALLLAGCAKVENEEIVPTPESGKRIVTLSADVDNSGTRVSVDESDGTYSWQGGEEVSVLIDDHDGGYLTTSSASSASGAKATFQVELDGTEELGAYAFSPATKEEWWGLDDTQNPFYLDATHTYAEGTTFMPMLGTISANKKSISFKAVGGVIKLTISNIPSNATSLEFLAKDTENQYVAISGVFSLSNDGNNDYISIEQEGALGAYIDFPGKWASTMAFFIPLPTGIYGGFELQFRDASNNDIAGAGKQVQFGGSGLPVRRSEVIIAPELELAGPDYSGEWIMVGEHNNSYYACPAYTSGDNNIDGVEVSISGDVVTSDNNTIKMTFTKITSGDYKGKYTIQDNNDWYLYAASSSNNYLKASSSINNNSPANYYWSIEEDGNGGFSIVASLSGNHNNLRYNGPNNLFACYATDSPTGSNVMLYRWDDAVIETPEPSGDVWTLVTDASGLAVGNSYVIVCNTKSAVAGPLNSGGYLTSISGVEFSQDQDKTTITYLPSDAIQFTLGGSTGAWTFTYNDDQLLANSSKLTFTPSESTNGTWSITFSNNNACITNGGANYGSILYNSNSPRFKTYTSSQTAIQLYRKQTSPVTDPWATVNESGISLSLTGSSNATTTQVRIDNVNYDAIKVGSSGSGGHVRINKPEGKRYLHVHLAAWNGETVKVSIKNSANIVIQELTLTSDSGLSGSQTPFALNGRPADYYFKIDTNKTEELDLNFESTTGHRFVVWGVNAD